MNRTNLFYKKLYFAIREVESEYYSLLYNETDETVHDLRVAIRRLHPFLHIYLKCSKDLKIRSQIEHTRNDFKMYFKSLDTLRDRQVNKIKLVELCPTNLKILDILENEISEIRTSVLKDAVQWNIGSYIDNIIINLLESSTETLDIKKHVRSMLKTHRSDIRELYQNKINSPADLHLLRIAIKKLRYVLETAEQLDVHFGTKSIDLKQFQEQLGIYQDLTVLKSHLETIDQALPFLTELSQLHLDLGTHLLKEVQLWQPYFL